MVRNGTSISRRTTPAAPFNGCLRRYLFDDHIFRAACVLSTNELPDPGGIDETAGCAWSVDPAPRTISLRIVLGRGIIPAWESAFGWTI